MTSANELSPNEITTHSNVREVIASAGRMLTTMTVGLAIAANVEPFLDSNPNDAAQTMRLAGFMAVGVVLAKVGESVFNREQLPPSQS